MRRGLLLGGWVVLCVVVVARYVPCVDDVELFVCVAHELSVVGGLSV